MNLSCGHHYNPDGTYQTYRFQVKDALGKIFIDRANIRYVDTITRIVVKGLMREPISFLIPCISVKFTNKITGQLNYLTVVRE